MVLVGRKRSCNGGHTDRLAVAHVDAKTAGVETDGEARRTLDERQIEGWINYGAQWNSGMVDLYMSQKGWNGLKEAAWAQ